MHKRPRVLLLTFGLPRDDSSPVPKHIVQEIKYLSKLPIDLHVIPSTIPAIEYENVRFSSLDRSASATLFGLKYLRHLPYQAGKLALSYPRAFLRAAQKNLFVEKYIKANSIDVIHSHWAFPDGTGGTWAAKSAKVPSIVTLRGIDINIDAETNYGLRLDPCYDAILKHSLSIANRITVASSTSLSDTRELIGHDSKVVVLPNGVDFGRFSSESRKRKINGQEKWNSLESGFSLLYVGELVAKKRVDVLLHAIAKLVEQGLQVRADIIGDGPLKETLTELSTNLKISHSVHFHGGIVFENLPYFFSRANAFVFPSAREGFGNVFLEAMASRLPLITTAVGFAKDQVIDGKNGLLVPYGCIESLASAITRLLHDPDQTRELAENAYLTVFPKYSIQNRVNAFYRLYCDLSGTTPEILE